MKWTKDQRAAIEYSGENILLAAAAGSGKTAVLVQRIIELISDAEKDVNINELLVLTFTDAAAREMREKIAAAIEKTLEENPEDKHLRKQKLLIHSANISTIHSFCMNLLKSNIHLTELPVNFTLCSNTEQKMLLSMALDGTLERFYGRISRDRSIEELVMGYGGIKNDRTLRETVLALFNFSKSMPYPAKWLNDALRGYKEVAMTKSLRNGRWQELFEESVNLAKDEILDLYTEMLEEIDRNLYADHPYAAFLSDEAQSIRRCFEHISGKGYAEIRDGLLSFGFANLKAGVRNPEPDIAAAQDKIKALRELAKTIKSSLDKLFACDEAEAVKRIAGAYPALRTLKNMVLMVDRRYTRLKREKNLLDFNDLEHEALILLAGKDGEPTDAALGLREKFKEILIDEYQDTNNIQDTLFKTLSRDNSNIFMVGDLKQSIYTFRNAVPKLFSDKYTDYEMTGGGGHLIRLFKNFRSRRGVVNTVNFVFRGIMSPSVGDINYTEEEYLIQGAEYPEIDDNLKLSTEFHLICNNVPKAEAPDKLELEARVAAKRISEMIDSKMPVFDKNSGTLRGIEYRDIVVLMRNTKTAAPVFEEVFGEYGIPVYTERGRSYLSSPEVQTVLAFLQIIDNPRQDIPLIAVMRSPIWGFSPEDLAKIRTAMRRGNFIDAVSFAAENGNKAAADFLFELEKLRERAEFTGVDRLIHTIYYEYGYYSYAGSMNRGTERQANLRLLFERAAEFENTRMSGLHSFMNYIETIKNQGDDLTPAKTFGDGDNVVRIMTIHKSKGLEFPVVILSDTAHEFNLKEFEKNILWNGDAGIAADFVDTKMRVRYPSPARLRVISEAKQALVSEEMRLLYVALTRAREKLIITATYKETKTGFSPILTDCAKRAKPVYIKSKKCFRDWLMAVLMTHPDAFSIREHLGFPENIVNRDADFDLTAVVYKEWTDVPDMVQTARDSQALPEAEYTENADEVKERLEYTYPDMRLGSIPVKMSVSEVKRMQTEEEYIPLLDELKTRDVAQLTAVTGAEKGTVVHFIMQLVNPKEVNSAEDIRLLIERLEAEKIITPAQAKAIDAEKIYRFFESSIGKRLKMAERVEREFSFYTKAPVSEIYPDGGSGEILLQGTMDCFFVEKGRVVLLDYKTDRVNTRAEAETRAKKYAVQMKYYKQALSEVLEKSVDECWLYFMECGEFVEM